MPNCVVFKYISSVILMICGVGFVALGGYYLHQMLLLIHDLSDITTLIMDALQVLLNNMLMITLWVACISKLRSFFFNAFVQCFFAFIIVLANCIMSIILKDRCSDQAPGQTTMVCDMLGNFVWLGPTIASFVLNICVMPFAIIRYAFYDSWDWD